MLRQVYTRLRQLQDPQQLGEQHRVVALTEHRSLQVGPVAELGGHQGLLHDETHIALVRRSSTLTAKKPNIGERN